MNKLQYQLDLIFSLALVLLKNKNPGCTRTETYKKRQCKRYVFEIQKTM